MQKLKYQSYNNYVTDNNSFSNILKTNNFQNNNTGFFSDLFKQPSNNTDHENQKKHRNLNENDNNDTNFTFLNNECMNIFGINFIGLIRKINEFMPKYKGILDPAKKGE